MALKTWATGENLLASGLNANFAEAEGTLKSIIPIPVGPFPTEGTQQMNSNTTMYVGLVNIPSAITVNKITIVAGTVTVNGTLDLTVYSEDGQTKLIAVTTGTISAADTEYSTTVGSILLPPGNYFLCINTNSTADITPRLWTLSNRPVLIAPSSKPVLAGTVTITAGTPPSTITPGSITQGLKVPTFLLNN